MDLEKKNRMQVEGAALIFMSMVSVGRQRDGAKGAAWLEVYIKPC